MSNHRTTACTPLTLQERACVEARGEANARGVLQTNPILGSGLGTGAHVSSLEQILRGVHAAAVASGRASNTRAAARPRTTKAMHEGGSFTGWVMMRGGEGRGIWL